MSRQADFTDEEIMALARVVEKYAERVGEDIVGALLHSGAFHELAQETCDADVVALSVKIDALVAKPRKQHALNVDKATGLPVFKVARRKGNA